MLHPPSVTPDTATSDACARLRRLIAAVRLRQRRLRRAERRAVAARRRYAVALRRLDFERRRHD